MISPAAVQSPGSTLPSGSASTRKAALAEIRIGAKYYTDRLILDRLNLTIRPGEIIGVVGASGCGKSTLLRIVAGLDTDFEGGVQLDGQRQDGPSEKIGVMFQEPRLLPWLDVARNVAFGVGVRRQADQRVDALLSEVGLAGHGQALPKSLSGGMAQRVALARSLFSQPALLLLDEPFSAVDALTRTRLQALLKSIAGAHGTAALLVTHDLDEALFLSHRIVVLGVADARKLGTEDHEHRKGPGSITAIHTVPPQSDASGRMALRDNLYESLRPSFDSVSL